MPGSLSSVTWRPDALGEVLDDREPEPGPAELAAPGLVDPVEALEDPLAVLGFDAGAVVPHLDPRRAVRVRPPW